MHVSSPFSGILMDIARWMLALTFLVWQALIFTSDYVLANRPVSSMSIRKPRSTRAGRVLSLIHI